jgi:hypothetical protein
MIMIWLIIILLSLFIFFSIISSNNINYLIKVFKRNNVIVYGKKGSGKDLLFSLIINKRKKLHYSNIKYNNDTMLINVGDLTLYPNTFQNVIDGNIEKIDPNLKEKIDIYISDGGIILPSQYDYLLDKKYPSLSIFYALQRHLYNSNIHINTQALTRVYKKVREQADGYIKVLRSIFIGPIFIQQCIYYDKYESAESSLLPMPKPLLNNPNTALYNQYNATNGIIKPLIYFGYKKHIKYNSRYFHNVFFKSPKDKVNANSL